MENPSGDLFDSCFFYYHLIEEVISTVAPGAVIIDTFIPFFLHVAAIHHSFSIFTLSPRAPHSDSSCHYRGF